VQSGDDAILEPCGGSTRWRSSRTIVHTFRRAYPRITLSTDVIVGFPGEETISSGKTMELIERIRPDIVNVTRFSPRVGTPAARMPNPIVGLAGEGTPSRQLTRMRFEIAQQIHETFVGEEVEVAPDRAGQGVDRLGLRTPESGRSSCREPCPLGTSPCPNRGGSRNGPPWHAP